MMKYTSSVVEVNLCKRKHSSRIHTASFSKWGVGVSLQIPLLDRDPSWTETPPGQRPLLDRDPSWTVTTPGQRPLLDRDRLCPRSVCPGAPGRDPLDIDPSDQRPPRKNMGPGSYTGSDIIQRRPLVNRMTDRRFSKYYLAPNFVCGR